MKRAVYCFVVAAVLPTCGLAAERQTDATGDTVRNKTFPIGRTNHALGTVLIVQGVLVDGPSKGDEDGPCLEIQVVDGHATQEATTIPVGIVIGSVYRWDENPRLPRLELGKTYEFEGFETGEFKGIPDGLIGKATNCLQSPFFHFRPEFQVYRGRQIAPIRFVPAQFVGRKAIFEGTTANMGGSAVLMDDGWTITVHNNERWPAWMEGKAAAALGVIRTTGKTNVFTLDGGQAYLIRLEDQIAHDVELRGYMHQDCADGHWTFWYRGRPVYADGFSALAGWSKDCSGRDMALCGILEKRQTVHDREHKAGGHQNSYFVRNAKLHPITALLPIERGRAQ